MCANKKEKKTGKYLLQYGPGPKIMNHTPWAEQRSTKPMPKLQGSLEDLWRGTAITRVKELLLSLGEGTKAAKNYTPVLKQKRQNQPVLGIFKAGGGMEMGLPTPGFSFWHPQGSTSKGLRVNSPRKPKSL